MQLASSNGLLSANTSYANEIGEAISKFDFIY